MSEFFLVACRKPLPTSRSSKFAGETFKRGYWPRPTKKDEKGTITVYCYLGTTEISENEFSPALWLETAEFAVIFKTQDEAETAAFDICTKHPQFIGCLEILSYSG